MKSSESLKARVHPMWVSPNAAHFSKKGEGKEDGGASNVMEKRPLTGRLKEQLVRQEAKESMSEWHSQGEEHRSMYWSTMGKRLRRMKLRWGDPQKWSEDGPWQERYKHGLLEMIAVLHMKNHVTVFSSPYFATYSYCAISEVGQ